MGAPVTSSDATRNITLACIVAGTVLLLVFVAWKMRRRVRCSSCWGPTNPTAVERRRVLAAAAVLYQAAASNPDFELRSSPRWCPQPTPSAHHSSPTLVPPDRGSPASWRSRSPVGSCQGEVGPALAAPPLRSRASPSGRPPLPPAPSRSPAQQVASRGASPASSQRQLRSPPQRRSVRELVRAWSGGSSLAGRERSPPAVTDAAAAAVADLEAQQLAPAHEARAFTWSQLGLSPAASPATSRRVSENAAAPPRLPLPASQQGEVHANPVFDWAAAGAALEGGAPGVPAAGSFSQVKRTASRSRLSRGVSFAEAAGEGSAHGGREGNGHSRRGSLLPPGGALEQGSRREAGGQMCSRPSEQSLQQLHCELEGIQE